jgi:Na+-transporting NADH:ubiquinone oxidoreductase subunit F
MAPVTQLLIGIGAVSAITTILAIIMVIADATIANYGDVQIKINNKRDLTVRGGKPLLASLMDEKIFIPSACGGRGSCGLCKIKVTSDVGEYLPTELPWISEEEAAQNIRLSCQLKVKRDIAVWIPAELFNVREYKCKVASIIDLTHDIKQVTLHLEDPAEISFKAGQFIQFQVPEYELTPEPVYRAYSIASQPSRRNEIELEIRLCANGICTTYVFKYLKVGDAVTVNGPYGDFYLRDTDARILFVAGGSGNAPIKSILYDMLESNNQREILYVFGARSARDLFLVDEMRDLEQKLANFKYIPSLSQPLPEDSWKGETGRVTEVLERYIDSGDNTEAYLCGSPGMIESTVDVLLKKGIPEEKIYYDKFA